MQPTTLADIEEHVWQCLAEGAGPGLSPFTMWQLASVGLDGAPQVRTVVLRKIDRASRTLMLHTDLRSAKVAELQREPRVSLVVCDLPNFRQIRIEGRATVHADDDLTRTTWAANRPHSLILYQTPHAPGTPVDAPEAAHVAAGADPAAGYVNFAVLEVALSRIEYLDISPGAHRRVVLPLAENGAAYWVAP